MFVGMQKSLLSDELRHVPWRDVPWNETVQASPATFDVHAANASGGGPW